MKTPLYCCYSLKLRDFLKDNGVRYELCALNPNNQKMFWIYIRNDSLDALLTKWSERKS